MSQPGKELLDIYLLDYIVKCASAGGGQGQENGKSCGLSLWKEGRYPKSWFQEGSESLC